MILQGELFTEKYKRERYSEELLQCLQASFSALEGLGDRPLMMLGKIQSGKTRSFIGLLALAFDNGFDLGIVLTKNANALARQTTSRLAREFDFAIATELLDVFDIMEMPGLLSLYEQEKKLIIVVKKEAKNLQRLLNFLESHFHHVKRKCLIIDDEADFTSIGYEKDKLTDKFSLRKIASQINELRLSLDCRFVQVTATPYALYLQPETLNIEEALPVKPMQTVLVPSGKGYVGGDDFFGKGRQNQLLKLIDPLELAILKAPDRRRFKEEDVLTSPKVAGFRRAVMNFIVAGIIRNWQSGGFLAKSRIKKFSFIIHTEIAKAAHQRQLDLLHRLLQEVKEATVKELVKESYDELSLVKNTDPFPTFEEAYQAFLQVRKNWIHAVTVNSDQDLKPHLDGDGQLKLSAPLTIFIGGSILDRGLTINNLIGFFYGRNPRRMQQDTVLQHARMYGYRHPLDLPLTRFYTTLDIYERMRQIHLMDKELRQGFEEGRFKEGVIFMGADLSGKIVPSNPYKILTAETKIIKTHSRIVPYGFQLGPKTKISSAEHFIANNLAAYNKGELAGEYEISKEAAKELVAKIYETFAPGEFLSVDAKEFLAALDILAKERVRAMVVLNRDMSRLATSGRFIDSPEGELYKAARQKAITEPVLIFMRQEGRKEKGWTGGRFWWPVLVAPKLRRPIIFSGKLSL